MVIFFFLASASNSNNLHKITSVISNRAQGCALRKTGIKKLRFPSDLRAKVRHQRPLVAAGEQPWGQILRRVAISDYNTIGVIFTRL